MRKFFTILTDMSLYCKFKFNIVILTRKFYYLTFFSAHNLKYLKICATLYLGKYCIKYIIKGEIYMFNEGKFDSIIAEYKKQFIQSQWSK